MSLSVAVAGASGYAGGELLRLLSAHPEFSVTTVTAFQNAGQPLVSVQPHLRSLAHLELQPTDAATLAGHDVVFLALPHGKSGEVTKHLPEGTLVVDCGADHRLTDAAAWAAVLRWRVLWRVGLRAARVAARRWRAASATPWSGSKRIAVPGCNVTAITLALAPGIRAGVIESDDLVAVLAVGPSGRGQGAAHGVARGRASRFGQRVPGRRDPPAHARDHPEPVGGGRRERERLVHSGAGADESRHPRHVDGPPDPGHDRSSGAGCVGERIRRRAVSFTCCRRASSRGRLTRWAPTPR